MNFLTALLGFRMFAHSPDVVRRRLLHCVTAVLYVQTCFAVAFPRIAMKDNTI